MPVLHAFQSTLEGKVYEAWNGGARNVVMRLATGGGKTVILSKINQDHDGMACITAHRHELVGQLSLAMARNGVRHDLIAGQATIKAIAQDHLRELGQCFYQPGAPKKVTSVDTLLRAELDPRWAAGVTLVTPDEAHHVVEDNKWHTALSRFTNPNRRGLLPTATPSRADKKGLGRPPIGHGIADCMVHGPPERWLIENGFLTDYRIFCVKSDMEALLDTANIGASGDLSQAQLKSAAANSNIVGDVVKSWIQFAEGLISLTFCPDVETAEKITRNFLAHRIPAMMITGKTDPAVRRNAILRLQARDILQLVVVDIVSEGFDLPAIQACSFARKTLSLPTYRQQFGRVLRTMPGKDKARVIDHVGNFLYHGPPDRPMDWTLESGSVRGLGYGIPQRVCEVCNQPYERIFLACTWCGTAAPAPDGRGSPKMVDGDIFELDAETLGRLRGEVRLVDMDNDEYRTFLVAKGVPQIGVMSQVKKHDAQREAQAELRYAMTIWGGARRDMGRSQREMQKEFYFAFGMTTLEAQALKTEAALELCAQVWGGL